MTVADVRSGWENGAPASWSDEQTGVTEEAAFVGPEGERILAFLHRPTAAPAVDAVVLCGSLFEDLTVNYRKELMVARELSRRGIASVRFQYRGAGNSDALPTGAVTFDTMVADAERAMAWLQERTGIASPVVAGFRMGALVAEHLAARSDSTPLVLWTPTLSGADYFRVVSRASKVVGVKSVVTRRSADAAPAAGIEGFTEILGHMVHGTSQDDLSARALSTTTSTGRAVLLIHVGLSEELTPALDQFVSQWRAVGADLSVLMVQLRQQWFVPEEYEPEDAKPESNTLATGLADWVEKLARQNA